MDDLVDDLLLESREVATFDDVYSESVRNDWSELKRARFSTATTYLTVDAAQ